MNTINLGTVLEIQMRRLLKINDTFVLRNVFLCALWQSKPGGRAAGRWKPCVWGSATQPPVPGKEGWQGDCTRKEVTEKGGKKKKAGKRSGMVWQALALESFTRSAVLWCQLLVSRCKPGSGSLCY